jgi:hypothetical protein
MLANQGVRDERVLAVVDGQRLDACHAEHLARRQKPQPDRVTLDCLATPMGLHAADERGISLAPRSPRSAFHATRSASRPW